MSTPFVVGLDLGQSTDFTALCCLRRAAGGGLEAPFLRRWPLGTSYPAIVADVAALLNTAPLLGNVDLIVDATGCGRPVVDMLRAALPRLAIQAVTITAGFDAHQAEPRSWLVPKKDLVSTLQVLLQTQRLTVKEDLEEAPVLVQELLNFQIKVTAAANEQFGAWREGAHDDLVLATALACWWAERPAPWCLDGEFLKSLAERTARPRLAGGRRSVL